MMKIKAYASFDDYVAGQSPKNQAIIRALRRFVKRAEDTAHSVCAFCAVQKT